MIEEVVIVNRSANIKLSGTLTIPANRSPKAVAILITGSGPQDRDETILGHKPFWVIADHLTKKGFAVLRMDDRGTAKSTGNFSVATTADFVTDISSALDYLKTRNDLPKNKIGLIGHSEGGMVAPMLASQRNDIAFVIMLAGLGINGAELLAEQQHLIALQQLGDKKFSQKKHLQEKRVNDVILFEKISSFDVTKPFGKEIKGLIKKSILLSGISEPSIVERQLEMMVKTYSIPWFRSFLGYQPKKYLPQVMAPILAINGSMDLQVASGSNLQGLKTILNNAQHKDYTAIEIEGLNHLFQTTETGAIAEYGKLTETFSPKVLILMDEWLNKRF